MNPSLPLLQNIHQIVVDTSTTALLDCVYIPSSHQVATATSSGKIILHSIEDTQVASTFNISSPISQLFHSEIQPNILLSSSLDGVVALWDLRQKNQASVFSADSELFCVAASPDMKLIASGGNQKVFVWDFDTGNSVGVYADLHVEDVTQVNFHPNTKELYSSSLDGLINIFDCSLGNSEEDTFISAVNVEQSIAKFDFYGPTNDLFYCITHTETLALYHLDQDSPVCKFPPDFRKKLSSIAECEISYFVDCIYDKPKNQLLLLAGNNDGLGAVYKVYNNDVSCAYLLPAIHCDVIRAVCHTPNLEIFITAGEDGVICVWNTEVVMKTGSATSERGGRSATSERGGRSATSERGGRSATSERGGRIGQGGKVRGGRKKIQGPLEYGM